MERDGTSQHGFGIFSRSIPLHGVWRVAFS